MNDGVDRGSGGSELPAFFECGKVLFDGIEVRAVGWQEQQDVRRVFKKSESWLCFVETGVVHDDNRRLIESREQVLFEPEIEPVSIG